MADRPPLSVLLPTTRQTEACSEIAGQLADGDELLVIHDDGTDPVAGWDDRPSGVKLIAAGEPAGCSGKANAIVAGMEAAKHERVLWTDDDFHHPPDWLATFSAAYDAHGPVSEVPYFVGRDPLSRLWEPIYAAVASLGIYLGDKIWGGAVLFERGDIDEAAFLRDLQRTVSDDALLMEHLDVTSLRRVRLVPIGGSVRETLERQVRWTKILWTHDPGPIAVMVLLLLLVFAAGLRFPLWVAAGLTVFHLAVNEFLGVRRWTALLAYPGMLVFVLQIPYAFGRRTFTWGGRRYRWPAKFEVTVVE